MTDARTSLGVKSLAEVDLSCPSIVVIGKFDGVHLGHQAILERAIELRRTLHAAGEENIGIVALSFLPLPTVFFNPQENLKLLNAPADRCRLLQEAGADLCIIQEFNRTVAELSAAEFIQQIRRHLRMRALVMGEDFALGRHRQGTGSLLRKWGNEQDFLVEVVGDIRREGYAVRSHTIRQLLQRGEVLRARSHLGRDHFITGPVGTGVRLARKLGFPTANVEPPQDMCLPLDGVYATWTWLQDPFGRYASVTNLGYRPTFNGLEHRMETHLLDYPEGISEDHLYGQQIAVAFSKRLRDERKFESVEKLSAQVQCDIAAAGKALQQRWDGISPDLARRLLLEERPESASSLSDRLC